MHQPAGTLLAITIFQPPTDPSLISAPSSMQTSKTQKNKWKPACALCPHFNALSSPSSQGLSAPFINNRLK